MTPEELIIKALENAVTSTETNIFSDLVKIGLPILGTIVGALLGYSASRKQTEKNFEAQIKTAVLARNTELDAQYLESKLKHFMEAQSLIDQFINIVADYCANVKNWNDHKREQNAELQTETKNNHVVLQKNYYKGFLLLGSAESKLLILGKTDIHQTYKSFSDKAKCIYENVYIDNESFSNEKISLLFEEFKQLKYKLFLELGEEIDTEHNKLLQRSNDIACGV